MSFFLGKDGSSNSIMHITKGHNTVNELKSGILPNTVFHSDLPFITYRLCDPTSVTITRLNIPRGTYHNYFSAAYARFSDDDIAEANSKKFFMIYYNGTSWKVYNNYANHKVGGYRTTSSVFWVADSVVGQEYPLNYSFSTVGTSYYRNAVFLNPFGIDTSNTDFGGTGFTIQNFKMVILNISSTGDYLPLTTSGQKIYLDNNNIVIKSLNLRNIRCVIPQIANSNDLVCYTLNGIVFQFLNSVQIAGNTNISTQNGSTLVSAGGKVIIDTSLPRNNFLYSHIQTIDIAAGSLYVSAPAESTRTGMLSIASGYISGELFVVSVTVYTDSGTIEFGSYVCMFGAGTMLMINKEYGGYGYSASSTLEGKSSGELLFTITYTNGSDYTNYIYNFRTVLKIIRVK